MSSSGPAKQVDSGNTPSERVRGIELAGGGLVWDDMGPRSKVAIVHRAQYGDWTLPKGRPNGNENIQDTAVREAQEETGWEVKVIRLVGSFAYSKEGVPKTVLIWHMVRGDLRYAGYPKNEEIREVAWLSPSEALERLTHPAEKEFLAQHGFGQPVERQDALPEEFDRLAAAVRTSKVQLASMIARTPDCANAWWAEAAQRSVQVADACLRAKDIDGGWIALNQAERFLIFGMRDAELLTRAATVSAEVRSKLTGWRHDAAITLFTSVKLSDWMKKSELISDDRSLLRDVVTQSLAMLHERNQNVYQRVRLVRRHLRYLVMVLATLLACIMALSMAIARGHPVFNPGKLLSIVVAGAVGGAVSSMYQVSRLGRAKIPEAHLQRLITMGRPLVGAAAGLFLYSVLQSNVINLPNKDELAMGLILGFIAGFSERFVLSTVSRVTAQTEKEN